jgi:hypothetical protein
MNLSRNAIVGIVLVVIIAAAFFLPQLLGGDDEDVPDPNLGVDGVGEVTQDDSNVRLGSTVAASSVDRDGCAVATSSVFTTTEPIYVVAENTDIPAGTSVFVRLYRDDQPIEDAPEITADQDYVNTCVNFVFEPVQGAPFEPGQYEAEFIVNGNQSNLVAFEVRQ